MERSGNTQTAADSLPASAGEHGASAVEYALLITLIALVIFAAVAALGRTLPGLFESVCPAFAC